MPPIGCSLGFGRRSLIGFGCLVPTACHGGFDTGSTVQLSLINHGDNSHTQYLVAEIDSTTVRYR